MSCLRAILTAALTVICLGGCGADSNATTDTSPTVPTKVSTQLANAIADAQRMAPALESRLRGTKYPTTLDEARHALTAAGLEPTAGNVVNGYKYHPDTIEFALCIEGPKGAFAAYDTRPMSLFATGETGGCPP